MQYILAHSALHYFYSECFQELPLILRQILKPGVVGGGLLRDCRFKPIDKSAEIEIKLKRNVKITLHAPSPGWAGWWQSPAPPPPWRASPGPRGPGPRSPAPAPQLRSPVT